MNATSQNKTEMRLSKTGTKGENGGSLNWKKVERSCLRDA